MSPDQKIEIVAAEQDRPSDWRAGLLLGWLSVIAPIFFIGIINFIYSKDRTISDFFFIAEDIPAILFAMGFIFYVRIAPIGRLSTCALPIFRAPTVTLAALAAAAAIVCAGGWLVVFHKYPISMDEFMAQFDAAIFRQGRLVAELPIPWRPYQVPLQPQFVIRAPDGVAWTSLYLPVNAMLRAGLTCVRLGWAAGAIYAVIAVIVLFALARQLWPNRPDAAVVAALLLATSSQFLITGMTPYAMSAHLAFNLVWLWLFLRRDWPSQIGAIGVATLATGLHQVVFHPLFAAPFVLGLWLSGRWRPAVMHTAAYAAIILGCVLYWKFVLPAGSAGTPGATETGVELLIDRLHIMLRNFSPDSVGFMAKNLVRFLAWQNPLLLAFGIAGTGLALKSDGTFRALIAGIGITTLVVWVLMPFQGHGWGYRYLHGFLGSFCLIAALGWLKLTEGMPKTDLRAAHGVIVMGAVFSLIVLAPMHAAQASTFVGPSAIATRAITRTPADVVLIDPTGLFYAGDLVRNDPFLRNRPKLMDLGVMTDDQLRKICSSYRVALFDRREGLALGLDSNPGKMTARTQELKLLLNNLRCGERTVPIVP